jgi:hypothetical protein
MCGIQGKQNKGGRRGGEVVHAGDVQKLIAAKVELGGGVTCRSTWYRG